MPALARSPYGKHRITLYPVGHVGPLRPGPGSRLAVSVATIRPDLESLAPCSPQSRHWPGNLLVCGSITATASLDCGCARRLGKFEVGTEKRLSRTKKLGKAKALLAARPEFLPHPRIHSS